MAFFSSETIVERKQKKTWWFHMSSIGHNKQQGSTPLTQEQDLMFSFYFCSKFYQVG